jgi:hypothetical protein
MASSSNLWCPSIKPIGNQRSIMLCHAPSKSWAYGPTRPSVRTTKEAGSWWCHGSKPLSHTPKGPRPRGPCATSYRYYLPSIAEVTPPMTMCYCLLLLSYAMPLSWTHKAWCRPIAATFWAHARPSMALHRGARPTRDSLRTCAYRV